ncbi:MAG: ABC transporter permease, partial [Pseudomonadota bacterium]
MPYNLRLAWQSIRRNPVLSALMVAAIAVGIGASMSTITVYWMGSKNPFPQGNERIYHVQLDSYPVGPRYEPGQEPPDQMSYTDATNLLADDRGDRQVASFKTSMALRPDNPDVRPFMTLVRATSRDFFEVFEVPFLFGSGWDPSADDDAARVAVLSRETNDRVFGGENSVGRTLRTDVGEFQVIGVIDEWNPQPKFYDMTNGAFNDAEDLFIPFSNVAPLELGRAGNTNCGGGPPINSFSDFLASECVWISYWVELGESMSASEYRSYLEGYIAQQKELGRFERESNYRLRDVREWLIEEEVVDGSIKAMVWLSVLFLVVCLLNTVGLILAKFLGRSPQIALRRALGASRTALLQQHLVEVVMIGAIGGVLGAGLAWLGLLGIRALMDSTNAYLYMDWTMVGAAILLAMASAAVAGLYPAIRIGRIAPARH